MRTILFGTGLALIVSSLTGCLIKDDNNDDGKSSTGSEASGSGGNGATGSGASTGTKGAGSSGASMSSGSSGEGGGGLGSCDTATLFAGDPFYDADDLSGWNPAGQPTIGDPPLRYRHLAAADGHVYIDTQLELWFTEGSNVKRAAGDETEPDEQYKPSGPCSEVRFLIMNGIATLPNGHVIVSDTRGNGIVEITDPTSASCTATPIAGNMETTFDTDIDGSVGAADAGDTDGPGATAKFYGVSRPTTDADGNIYVIDQGNSKIKKIANDAAHTVSTLYDYSDADERLPMSMTAMNGKLYVSGATIVKDFLWSFDTAAPGDPDVLYFEIGHFAEIDSSTEAIIYALDNDGTNLIGSSNKGYVFRISPTGAELGVIAGMGQIVDFPDSTELDVSQPIPTASLPIKGYGVNEGGILRSGKDVYTIGVGANGLGYHMFDISCP